MKQRFFLQEVKLKETKRVSLLSRHTLPNNTLVSVQRVRRSRKTREANTKNLVKVKWSSNMKKRKRETMMIMKVELLCMRN